MKAISFAILSFNDAKALAAVMRGTREWAVPEQLLTTNKVPVLGLVGSLDPLKREVESMASRLRGMNAVVIPGANHMTTLGQPEFAAKLSDFLAKHRAN